MLKNMLFTFLGFIELIYLQKYHNQKQQEHLPNIKYY